jgi:hypothetical protein
VRQANWEKGYRFLKHCSHRRLYRQAWFKDQVYLTFLQMHKHSHSPILRCLNHYSHSVTRIIMPRGHYSKLRDREKRRPRKAQSKTHSVQDAQTIAGEKRKETPSSLSPLCSADVQLSSVAESLDKSKKSQLPIVASISALHINSDEEAKSQDDEIPSTSWAQSSTGISPSTVRDDIAVSLVQFMLRNYSTKEPIKKEKILSHIIPQNKEEFPKILRKASEFMFLAFGIDIKEIHPTKHTYALVNMFGPNGEEILNGGTIQPRNELLMMMLCLSFMNGNCINEDYIWEVLNRMGVYAGVNHSVYGNVKKLIIKDFVSDGYLEYQQVPYQ